MKRVGLYLRVSTDEQTIENQRLALMEACARRGWQIVEEFVDDGIAVPKGATGGQGLIGCTKL